MDLSLSLKWNLSWEDWLRLGSPLTTQSGRHCVVVTPSPDASTKTTTAVAGYSRNTSVSVSGGRGGDQLLEMCRKDRAARQGEWLVRFYRKLLSLCWLAAGGSWTCHSAPTGWILVRWWSARTSTTSATKLSSTAIIKLSISVAVARSNGSVREIP